MGILALLTCILILVIEIRILKRNLKYPTVLFFALWAFILFLSILNLYNITAPTNEAFSLILIMIISVFAGDLIYSKKITKYKANNPIDNKYVLSKWIFNIVYLLLVIFTLIDVIIIIKNYFNGVPLYEMRRWRMGTFGVDSNPILNRRSFVEETFRSVILNPFETIIYPISAFLFINSDSKKEKISFLIKALLFLVLVSIAGGGGRLTYIYFFGCYLLAFIFMDRSKVKAKVYNKYKKYLIISLIAGVTAVFFITGLRTTNSFISQAYKYFAMSPTLLSEWLPTIKDFNHTYGFLSLFGVHTYIFRFFEKVGLTMLVPNIYYDSFNYLLAAEKFKYIGFGVGNAFVSPIYYFYIDGGIPFVCIASILFGFIISRYYEKFSKSINIRSFSIYCLIMYAVFITFIRVQTTMPGFIISIIMCYLITKPQVKKHA